MARYYIVYPDLGDVYTTNDREVAKSYSMNDEYFVIDSEANELLQYATVGETSNIPTIGA